MNVWAKAGLLLMVLTPGVASAGMVAFFDRIDGACPEGWKPAVNVQGRLIRGTVDGNRVGNVKGTPMKYKSPPEHSHALDIALRPVSQNVAAVEEFWPLEQIKTVASAGWYSAGGGSLPRSGRSDGNVPYMQMLVCEEQSGATSATNMRNQMVAFFNDRSCPANWEPYGQLKQRYVVPAPDDTEAGAYNQIVGLMSNEHSHGVQMVEGTAKANQVGIRLTTASMGAAKQGLFVNSDGWAKAQSPVNSISTHSHQDTHIPYIELLPCRKTRGRGNIDRLPGDLLAFMAAEACPRGWREKSSSHGRYLVGLPKQQHAKSGTAFGGAPLRSGEVRDHNHSVNYTFDWPARPFAGNVGSQYSGFAAAGNYDLIGTTQQGSHNLPYVQMRHCIAPAEPSDTGSGIRQ